MSPLFRRSSAGAKSVKSNPTPSDPYVEIQRVGEYEYELTLKDPADWHTYSIARARSPRHAEEKAEAMLREYAREKGYQQEFWVFTLAES